jgi:hypothetical protein
LIKPVTLSLVVLYGCKNWFLSLREEHRLEMSEKVVLRRTYGPQRKELTGWRKLQNEDIHNFNSLPIRVIGKENEIGGKT